MTDRMLRALECPWVDVLGHPTGRLLLKREPAAHGHVQRSSLPPRGAAWRSRSTVRSIVSISTTRTPGSPANAACRLVISTDAHSVTALEQSALGRADGPPRLGRAEDVLNTRSFDDFRASLRRHRRR